MLLNVLSLIPIHSRKGLINNRILINTIRSSSNTIRSSSNSIRSSNDRYIEKRREFQLTNDEEELFELFRNIVDELKLGSTIRIAGGWVRDKLLGVKGKPDIDVALDNMTGRDFINSLNTYYKSKGQKTIHVGIIQQNPEKSKHLETATAQLGIFSVDFVNLRTETYADNSRIPIMEIGTPEEDASRRDLTINALFYNVNTNYIEDYTGTGLKDLEDRIVRTPLAAFKTLEDDPLRALRAIRFACRFNFKMEDELVMSCADQRVHDALKTKVSYERINAEFDAMMIHPLASRAIVMLYESGLIKLVFPVPSADQILENGDSTVKSPEVIETFHTNGVALNLLADIIKREETIKEVVDNTGEEAKIFRIGSLTKAGSPFLSKHPTKMKRQVSLTERILLLGLKMKSKDVNRIIKLHDSSEGFVKILNKIISCDKTNTDTTNTSYGVLSRLELGLAIREAGSNYQYPIVLAASEILLEHIKHNTKSMDDIVKKLIKTLETSKTLSSSLSTTTLGFDLGLESNKYDELILSIQFLFKAINVLGLELIYDTTPILSGAEIKKMLPKLPPNETFGIIMDSQIKWMLEHPSNDDVNQETELREYILNMYSDYR